MLGNTVAQYLYLDSRGTMMQAIRPNGSAFCVALGRMASLALANLKRIEMETREERIRADLAAAAIAQKFIMPQRVTEHGPFHCIGESRAGQYVGGDFFDVIPLPENKLAVAVGDVTGKGIAASVLMTATQGFLHASLLQHADPGRAINALNTFVQPRKPESKFVTMWVGVFDADAGTLRYVDAGHSYALLRRASGAKFEQLNKGVGLPVGLDESGNYRVETIPFTPGDEMIVVSDGIVEQFGIVPRMDGTMAKEQFDIAGLEQAMKSSGDDRVQDLFAAVVAHAGSNQLSDDATAVLVRFR
jgi:serine phosphatase RsbU (regulator of sigma subunit)